MSLDVQETKLCEACQALFRGTCEKTEVYPAPLMEGQYKHHATAESLDLALGLGCAVCIRLRAAFVRDCKIKIDGESSWKPLTYDLGTHEPYHEITFFCGRNYTTFIIEPWTELPKTYGEVVSRNTGDTKALEFFRAQYDRCLKHHGGCLGTNQTGELPIRVIDVGDGSVPWVRLCDREQLPTGAQYVALSHCWGTNPPSTLTQLTEETFRHGVSAESLPKTFLHAIAVTRKFELRYLWIDSICIFQDDLSDWELQASLMRDVYRNATFCIAATAAEDGTAGLFYDRDYDSLTPVKVEATWLFDTDLEDTPPAGTYWCGAHSPMPHIVIDRAALNKRAWVAQERYLSARTLHFTRDVLFWECQGSFTSEIHPDGVPRCTCTGSSLQAREAKETIRSIRSRLPDRSSDILRSPQALNKRDSHSVYWIWYVFRTLYTRSQLSKQDDVLVALRGIAQDFEELLNDKLVFGLWRGRLVEEMTWYYNLSERNPDCNPPSWSHPSWSWVKTASLVERGFLSWRRTRQRKDQYPVNEVVNIIGIPSDNEVSIYPTLHPIVMRCRLIPSSFAYDLDATRKPHLATGSFGASLGHDSITTTKLHVHLDGILKADRPTTVNCFFLVLRTRALPADRKITEDFDSGTSLLEGLLVVFQDERRVAYKRIGYCYIEGHSSLAIASDIFRLHRTLEDETIHLV